MPRSRFSCRFIWSKESKVSSQSVKNLSSLFCVLLCVGSKGEGGQGAWARAGACCCRRAHGGRGVACMHACMQGWGGRAHAVQGVGAGLACLLSCAGFVGGARRACAGQACACTHKLCIFWSYAFSSNAPAPAGGGRARGRVGGRRQELLAGGPGKRTHAAAAYCHSLCL